MPYSFVDIEKDKSRTIWFVFSFLILFYFLTFWAIAWIVLNFSSSSSPELSMRPLSAGETFLVFVAAFIVGLLHWAYTISNMSPKTLSLLGAEELNDKDTYHKMFQNIVDEVSVATGGRKIQGVVIPSIALNAFALSDFKGQAVIGITEGLLARLSREQLEAVVGHEAAHIVSGDCLSTSVTSSLFELYNGILRTLSMPFRSNTVYFSSRSSRRGNNAYAVILLVMLILFISKGISMLFRMFISRQREYRADAIAVRLTRNPLALAEALYGIAYHWRGAGLPAEELESIFIISPSFSMLDHSEDSLADLFSTHPPVQKRIDILLSMAHTDAKDMIKAVEAEDDHPRSEIVYVQPEKPKWMVRFDNLWKGPFGLDQLKTMEGIQADTWVQRLGENIHVAQLSDDPILKHMKDEERASTDILCPHCQVGMIEVLYEGLPLGRCPLCEGTLIRQADMNRVVVRRDMGFSEEIKHLGETIDKKADTWYVKKIDRHPDLHFSCPLCRDPQRKMIRRFYSMVYPIEIDECTVCGVMWFDKDELGVLQYLIEKQTALTKN